MNRRTFLLGATGAGTVALGGCLGRSEERFTLRVADYNFEDNEEGYLEAWATVSNVGNEYQEGTLYISATLNDEPVVRDRNVALDAHQTRKYTVTYDVKWEDVRNYSLDAEVDPPTS